MKDSKIKLLKKSKKISKTEISASYLEPYRIQIKQVILKNK